MRRKTMLALGAAAGLMAGAANAQSSSPPRLLQQPAISHGLIAFSYAGDIWTVPQGGGKATRLTTGVGVENAPIFSPDGQTIAFTGDYDGNTDVYTVPVSGGVPHRVTYHPAPDAAVGWSADGKRILFRSNRDAASRYTQLYSVAAAGGAATRLPLPMAYDGRLSPDGTAIAYNPLAPAFSFDFTNFVAWGNYRGGRAGTIWLTTLPGLNSTQIPHEQAADFSPVFLGGRVYFLSGRHGRIGVFAYDPATKAVSEVWRNDTDSDVRSLSSDGQTLVFDRLGELYTLTPGGAPQRVQAQVAGDLPDVRARILNVSDEVENVGVSSTGLRAVVEAHGEILTVPLKHGSMRNLTNTPGVMEREPAWSPDGQSVAYFSDEGGLYALHVASQTGAREDGPMAVRKYKLAPEAAYYFSPLWSPDSKKIAFTDNRLNTYVLDLATGKLTHVGEPDVFGGFTAATHAMAWSPDSKWLAYQRFGDNHMHVLMLFSTATGSVTQLTDSMADSTSPTFDRDGKYLYFLASNNAGATESFIDMTSDVYRPTSSIYALALTRTMASPTAPENDDEKTPAEAAAKAKSGEDVTPAGQAGETKAETKAQQAPPTVKPTAVDLAGLSTDQIAGRISPLPLPAKPYRELQTGKPGVIYALAEDEERDADSDTPPGGSLIRWTLEDRKTDTLAEHVEKYRITDDGEKMLVAIAAPHSPDAPSAPGMEPKLDWYIAPADKALKTSDPDVKLKLDTLEVRVDPQAEWKQMYHEVWRIERSYFYDARAHGYDTAAAERRLEPYLDGLQSRADLNYLFQEMLTGFSVGHLRGSGGAIPSAPKVPGGLLGADYVAHNGHWCLAKIYTGGTWSPQAKAPLAQPGLNVAPGDCIAAVDGQPVGADEDIQKPLEGTAGHAITLTILPVGGGASRDITVIPVASEARLRNLDWIETNRRKVAELSGGKLAYVYLPDTGQGGFTSFNRYFFAQTNRSGVIVDERFNAGGQIADYVVEVLGRKIEAYWQPRYGAIDHTPYGAIYGPKVMIANEVSGSGGDAMPWLFKHNQLGPLVGKRTWGGLVGIGPIPVLMDGGHVTSPSVAFFSPAGAWEVENHGVDPDYPVEMDAKAVAAGHDPQLEAAVSLAMDELAKKPPPAPRRPAYPNYWEKP
ncbi:MAG TPA: PDZ domain-containing protein [Caulobacteraceae bacterium]|nr:PDZ domain-containing protein [Caulobacteraceae bacterium]